MDIETENRKTGKPAELAHEEQVAFKGGQNELTARDSYGHSRGSSEKWDELQSRATVRERPFVSHLPIIGRFVALFRETWNSVAAKWYVRSILQQQNLFNQTVVQVVQELHDYLDQTEEQIIYSDRDVTMLARKVAEGEYRLRQWEERAARERADLAERLSRFEEMMKTEDPQGQAEDDQG
jgi:hypothetical protein